MKEVYIPVKGYEDVYGVSNFGNIRSLRYDRQVKPFFSSNGYLHFELRINGVCSKVKMHRLVAQHFLQNPNKLPCVNHIDGDKTNNNVKNLEWCTYSRNNSHTIRRRILNELRAVFEVPPEAEHAYLTHQIGIAQLVLLMKDASESTSRLPETDHGRTKP